MIRRRTTFAAPFVVTACWSQPPPPAEPAPAFTPAERLVPVEPALRSPPEPIAEAGPAVPIEGALIVQPYTGSDCYLVYERSMRGRTSRTVFDEGSVPCPADGPNVKLPAQTTVTIGRERYRLDAESLQCSQEILGNPPSWRRSECPAALIPEVVGVTPDANCIYRGVKVRTSTCQPAGLSRTLGTIRIVNIQVVTDGVEVVIAAGTDRGLAKGATVRLRGVAGTATISSCTARTCRATFHATADQIRASAGSVTVE